MPIFDVVAPDGRKVRLEGPEPPNDVELDEIFANLPQGAVEKLNSTEGEAIDAETQAILNNPEWQKAARRPGVFEQFASPDNTLNPLNLPGFFMRGLGKATAEVMNLPARLGRATGMYPETEEVFGATPQTQEIPLPAQGGRPMVNLVPELRREEYSPVTRAVGDIASGFTTPENLATLPVLPSKLIQALFLTQTVPAAGQGAVETLMPGRTAEQRIESGVHTGAAAAFSALLGRGVAKQTPASGIRPTEEPSLTMSDKTDIRGRGVRAGFSGEPTIIGGEPTSAGAPTPTFYEFPGLIKPAYQAAGQPKQGGQISFMAKAGAEAVPSARQAANSLRLLREVSEQERLMQGRFVPAEEVGRGTEVEQPQNKSAIQFIAKNEPLGAYRAVVSQEPTGQWRVSYFTKDNEALGHHPYPSREAAMAELTDVTINDMASEWKEVKNQPLNPGGALKDLPPELQEKSNAVRAQMQAEFDKLKAQETQTRQSIISEEDVIGPREETDVTGITHRQWSEGVSGSRTRPFDEFNERFAYGKVKDYTKELIEDALEDPEIREIADTFGIDKYDPDVLPMRMREWAELPQYANSATREFVEKVFKRQPELESLIRSDTYDKFHADQLLFLRGKLRQEHGLEGDEINEILRNYKQEGRKRLYDIDPELGYFADVMELGGVESPIRFEPSIEEAQTGRAQGKVAEGIVPTPGGPIELQSLMGDFLSPDFWEKELGFAKEAKVGAAQMWNRMRNKLGPESQAWKMLETNEDLKKEFMGRGSLTTEEAKRLIGEKGPRVEVKGVREELSMVGKDKATPPVDKGIGAAGRRALEEGRQGETGAFSLQPVAEAARLAKKGVETGVDLVRAYAEPIAERLGRVGGPVAKKVTEEAHGILKQGKYWYGQITPEIDAAKKEFGGATPFSPTSYGRTSGVTTQGTEPTTWVRELNPVTKGAAFNNFYGANEGAVKVPSDAQGLIKVGDTANRAVGNLAIRANPDFKPTGKLQRILSNFGYDVVRRGGGEAWDNWAEGVAEVNKGEASFQAAVAKSGKAPVDFVKDFLHKWKKELDQPRGDATTLDRIAQDFHRFFPRTVTHVKSLGAWHEVLVADPFNYFESAAQRTAHAVAFREVYPLVRDSNTGKMVSSGLLQRTRDAVMKEVPTDVGANEFDNLMRTLQGHPLDVFTGGVTAPDVPVGMGYRMTREVVMKPIKALMLSANAPVNLSEVVAGGPTIFLGARNVTKGMARLAKENRLYESMESQGLVNRAIYNMANDPNSPVRSAMRRMANATSKTTFQQSLNELQEATAAVTAKTMADRVRGSYGSTLTPHEMGLLEQTIRAMGVTKERAAKAVRNRDEEALQIFESKAASWLTAGNQAMGEMSRAGASRVFNELFWFHRYSQMVANQFRAVGGNLAEDLGTFAKSPTKANWKGVRYNAELMGRQIAGRGMQGAATIAVMAAVTGGVAGFVSKKNEAEDAPLAFAADSFLQGVGGPLSILRRLVQDSDDSASLEQNLVELSPPVGMAGDFYDLMWSVGRYEGRRPDERIAMFLESKTPAWKGVKTGLALFHIGEGDHELEAATRSFYRWRSQQEEFPRGTEERVDLRTQVKRVKETLLEGGDWQGELAKTKDLKYASDALRAGTLLEINGKALTAEQTKALEAQIGKRAVEKLRLRDAAVRELAREIGAAETKARPVTEIKQPTGALAKDYATETQRREAVGMLLSQPTKKVFELNKFDVPVYETDIAKGTRVRELKREEIALMNEVFAQQVDRFIAPLATNAAFNTLPLPRRRERLADRVATARSRAQNVIRARLAKEGRKE